MNDIPDKAIPHDDPGRTDSPCPPAGRGGSMSPAMQRFLSLGLSVAAASVSTHAETVRPNIVVVMTDDQGYGDLSLHGNPVLKTPHLDALGRGGVRLEQFHVTPMCSPTRAAFLTGLHTLRNGAISTCQGQHSMKEGLPTLPGLLAGDGYATGLFGKWHLGRNYPHRPQDRGFQETLTLYGYGPTGISSRWNNDYIDTWVVHNGEERQLSGFCTDAFFDQAMRWMEDQAREQNPFFAFISTNAPHFPFWAPAEWAEPYADTDNAEFFAMVANIDDNMGRLHTFLQQNDLEQDTIVVFLTDNGGTGGRSTWNAGMTGGKATPWEGGHRVPLLLRYPARGLTDGRQVRGLALVEDLLPTLLGFAGVPLPNDADITGIDWGPHLTGPEPWPDRTEVRIHRQHTLDPTYAAAMRGPWRVLWGDALYNLDDDPAQQVNVAEAHPEIFRELWTHLKNEHSAHRATASAYHYEVIGAPQQRRVVLDGSHWLDVRGDGQPTVRLANYRRTNGRAPGVWGIDVRAAGTYTITLTRWPRESGLTLQEGAPPFVSRCQGKPLPEGIALPIARASLEIGGRLYQGIADGDERGITFEVTLPEGRHEMASALRDENGQMLCPAYFAYVVPR